jgi:hypothetical protein
VFLSFCFFQKKKKKKKKKKLIFPGGSVRCDSVAAGNDSTFFMSSNNDTSSSTNGSAVGSAAAPAAASSQQQQSQPQSHTSTTSSNVSSSTTNSSGSGSSSPQLSRKESGKKFLQKLGFGKKTSATNNGSGLKSTTRRQHVVSEPFNVQHNIHVNFDSKTGFEGLPAEWEVLLSSSGITRQEVMDNPETVLEVISFGAKFHDIDGTRNVALEKADGTTATMALGTGVALADTADGPAGDVATRLAPATANASAAATPTAAAGGAAPRRRPRPTAAASCSTATTAATRTASRTARSTPRR